MSGYIDQLEAGIIIIGGASQLNGLAEYFADKSKMPVKKGGVKRVYINNVSDLIQNPAFTQSLGLLLFGNENCEKKEVVAPAEPVYTAPVVETQPQQPIVDKKEDQEEDSQSKKKKKKEDKKQTSLFSFFEKIQNFGGTMFEEEE